MLVRTAHAVSGRDACTQTGDSSMKRAWCAHTSRKILLPGAKGTPFRDIRAERPGQKQFRLNQAVAHGHAHASPFPFHRLIFTTLALSLEPPSSATSDHRATSYPLRVEITSLRRENRMQRRDANR